MSIVRQHRRLSGSNRHKDDISDIASYDWLLLTVVLVLLCIGLIMVLSASGMVAERLTGDKYYFFKRQCLFTIISGIVLWVMAVIPRSLIYKLQYPFLFVIIGLLFLTITPLGAKVNGARRWISLGLFSIQPLEFTKIALALYLAYFMSTKQELVKTFSKGVIPPFAVTFIIAIMLLVQPDFGGAMILIMILFFMCLVGGTRFIYLFLSIAMSCTIATALVWHSPYRARRLAAFLNPFQDAQNTGYQLVQSLYALGSGGFWGAGIGGSNQKMFYLPEAHNDFIMSVIGEELGFLGITIVMALLFLFFVRSYLIVVKQRELRDRLSAFAVTLVIALGCILNLAVIMGMAPPKGVAMPFLSYGGSSLLATMCCVGLLLNFSRIGR